MRQVWRRWWSLVRRGRLDRELNEEIAMHLAMQEEEFRHKGMSPAEAHRAALREFGGVAQTEEAYRERRGIPWLESAAQDVRYGMRGLRRNPGLAVAAVLSLALGIGANTAIFSLFHALMLRMLPVARPEELVNLYRTGGWGKGYCSYPLYQEVAARTDLFTGVIARTGVEKVRFTPRPGEREQFAYRELVSGNYFRVLGIAPALGRLFTEDDNRVPGGHPLAVLSYDLWQNRYAADPRILGATVLAGEKPLTVIGVAAPGFHGVEVERRSDLWVPAMMADTNIRSPNYWWVWIMARVRPEVPRKQAAAVVDVLMQRHLAALYPPRYNAAFRKRALGQRLEVRDAGVGISLLRAEFSRPLEVLMIAVWLVLLAACANVANLLLARGAARRRETALRFSLGATRGRLVRQSLTESAVLGVAGAALGIALATWGARVILRFLPEGFGDSLDTSPEPAVLAFTLGISALSVILFGLVPALRSTAVNPASGLRAEALLSGGRPVLRRCLVAAQVALSAVLVVLAGLFAHSLFELRSVDLGFHDQNVIAFSLGLPRSMQKDSRAAIKDVTRRLETSPGIASVSYGFPGPFQMGTSSASIRVPGSQQTVQEPKDVETGQVAARYFETIGTPVVLGREFDRSDTATSRKVAVVNEAFVRMFFPEEKHPDARTLSFDDSKPEGGEPTWIVGVVSDIRHADIQKEAKPTVYVPFDQGNNGFATIVVRARMPAAALLGSLYRELPKVGHAIVVSDFGTIRQHIDDSIFEQRLLAAISGFFGVLALVLAAVGLYGVIAYGTALRTAEIGVRIALGARRSQLVWTILGDSLALVGAGLAMGLLAAMGAARAVRSLLFGIQPADPMAFIVTALVLAAAGLAAALLPARRAARLDPMRALRHE
ncbi:MAG: ADOP family duplicated permease [Bryobacteraceae bacterium]